MGSDVADLLLCQWKSEEQCFSAESLHDPLRASARDSYGSHTGFQASLTHPLFNQWYFLLSFISLTH